MAMLVISFHWNNYTVREIRPLGLIRQTQARVHRPPPDWLAVEKLDQRMLNGLLAHSTSLAQFLHFVVQDIWQGRAMAGLECYSSASLATADQTWTGRLVLGCRTTIHQVHSVS